MTRCFKRLVIVLFSIGATAWATSRPLIPRPPAGFTISAFATVPNARQMALSPKSGYLYVGSMEAGKVHVVVGGKTQVLLDNLTHPSGVVWHNGDLYVSEISRISVIKNVDALVKTNKKAVPVAIKSDLPKDFHHGWKYLAVGPDGLLYFPVGAPCNVCAVEAPYGALHRMRLDGTKLETLARGIRNTVGFTFHPTTRELWFTDMGRDMMGDDLPPDEVNVLKVGGHYGFPYLHASNVKDPFYFAQKPPALNLITPVADIPAHSAPIGITFTHKTMLDKKYPGCALVALHGSWNRSKKSGYEVVVGCPDKTNQIKTWTPFLTGFLDNQTVLGRPVDLLWLNEKTLLVSDDHAGMIWQIKATP